MKLLFDARWIKPNSPDGISRFSSELIKQLAKNKGLELTLLISSKQQVRNLPKLPAINTNTPSSRKELGQAKRLNNYGFDIVYSPHFVFGGKGRNFKLVRTVHDLIPYRQKSPNRRLMWRLFYSSPIFLKNILKNSDGVVTVSKSVKTELKSICKLPIEVIYNAPTQFKTKNSGQNNLEILYIGRYSEHKNVETLIVAMQNLPEYTLLLAGNCPSKRRQKLLKNYKLKNIKFLGIISDKDYEDLLGSVNCLINPSFDEGFGLPLIEAMQTGCPVVCSDIAVFNEVAGDAALFFKPNSPNQLAERVRQLTNSKIRHRLFSAGQQRASLFSWQKSSDKLQSFLSEISGE